MDDTLNTAPCGFLSFGHDGTVGLVNDTLLDLLGYPREQVEGATVEKLLTVGSRIFYQTHWFPLLKLSGGAEEIFLTLRSSDGESVGFFVNTARRERGGRVTYDSVLMRVRERQKYEDELLRARRTAESALKELQERSEELELANLQLEEQAVELEAQHLQLVEQAAELENFSDDLQRLNRELQERGNESERLRAVSEEANRAKSSFLAVMSHELRTPLNAIAGYVEILSMGIHGAVTEKQVDTLAKIGRSQRHLLRLINDVLNLARIEAGRVEYLLENMPVRQLVISVRPMIDPQVERKGLELTVELPADLVVRADREKIEQILLNLLSNAIKFTPQGGGIRVTARGGPDGDAVEIVVEDTGIGIPADKLDSVFEPFIQVDTSGTRITEGSGLGLAISRDLARGMAGDIRAVSELGKGSTFILTLPAGAAVPDTTPPSPTPTPSLAT